MEKVKVSKKIIIHGDFKGKYHGNEIVGKSVFTDLISKLLRVKLKMLQKNFLNISQINPFPLKQIKLIMSKYKSKMTIMILIMSLLKI